MTVSEKCTPENKKPDLFRMNLYQSDEMNWALMPRNKIHPRLVLAESAAQKLSGSRAGVFPRD